MKIRVESDVRRYRDSQWRGHENEARCQKSEASRRSCELLITHFDFRKSSIVKDQVYINVNVYEKVVDMMDRTIFCQDDRH